MHLQATLKLYFSNHRSTFKLSFHHANCLQPHLVSLLTSCNVSVSWPLYSEEYNPSVDQLLQKDLTLS